MKKGWKEVTLEEIADSFSKRFDPEAGENRPYLGLDNIEQGSLKILDVGSSEEMSSSKKVFHSGDILFGRLRPYFRKVVQPDFDGVCSGEFIVIRTKGDVSQLFLFYLIADKHFIKRATKICSGVERPRAKWSVIKKFKVKIPPSNAQRKIATMLSYFDDLIEINEKRIETLEKIAEVIYQEWFINFRFPGYGKFETVYNEKLEKEIPEGWKVKKLEDFGEIVTGNTPSTNEEDNYGNFMLFVKPPDLYNGTFCIETGSRVSKKGVKTQENRILPEKSIMVSCIGKIGLTMITTRRTLTNQQINSIIPDFENHLEYLYFSIKRAKPRLEKLGSSGATVPIVNKTKFSNLGLIYPPVEVIQRYHETVEPFFSMIRALLKTNENLRKTRDMLLPRLVTGHIDVSDLDIEVSNNMGETV